MGLTARPEDTFTIRDLETLKVMTDPLRPQIFDLLIQEPLSAKQIAEKLGLATSKLYYHLTLMEKHGLIVVVDTRTVANLIEKVYQAAAPNLEIDPSLLSFSTRAGQETLYETLAATLNATRDDILRSFQARAFELEQGAPERARRVIITHHLNRIAEARADEFRERLQALIVEFEADQPAPGPDEEVQTYGLTVAFYPSFYYPMPAGEAPAP